jgi:hypothetical protein
MPVKRRNGICVNFTLHTDAVEILHTLVTDKKGYGANVIKLSSNMLLYQRVVGFSPRFREQWVRFGPTFDRAGLDTVRAVGIDHQRG